MNKQKQIQEYMKQFEITTRLEPMPDFRFRRTLHLRYTGKTELPAREGALQVVAKWSKMVIEMAERQTIIKDGGGATCGYCQAFKIAGCQGCPISKDSKAQGCDSTPYPAFRDAAGDGKFFAALQAAIQMLGYCIKIEAKLDELLEPEHEACKEFKYPAIPGLQFSGRYDCVECGKQYPTTVEEISKNKNIVTALMDPQILHNAVIALNKDGGWPNTIRHLNEAIAAWDE